MDNELTVSENFQLFQYSCKYPALTVLIPTRRRLGLRTLKSSTVTVMAAIMLALGFYSHSDALMVFAVVNWLMGHWQAWNRWQELKCGDGVHTQSLGTSPLEYIPLPAWLVAEERIYRLAHPAVIFGIGLLIMLLDRPLGLWVAGSALCLRIYEEWSYQHALTALLDPYDSKLQSGARDEALQRLIKGEKPLTRKDSESAGLPTSVGDDIRAQIEKRMAESDARAAARRSPIMETVSNVKEAASTVKEAAQAVTATAQAVSAVKKAAGVPEVTQTIIIAEREVFVPIAAPPTPVALAAGSSGAAHTNGNGMSRTLTAPSGAPELPSPPNGAD